MRKFFVNPAITLRTTKFAKIIHLCREKYYFDQIFDYGNVDTTELKNKVKDNELKKLVDDYYQLDFEDVIAGGISKFQTIYLSLLF